MFQMLFAAVTAMAVPAQKGLWRTITLTDGSQVKVELTGDEFMSYWKAEDGRCFVKNGETYVAANLKAMASIAAQKRHLRDKGLRRPATRSIGQAGSYIGKKKGLIILVQFPDLKFQDEHNNEYYQNVANKVGFSEGDYVGSVHDYFYDQSNGLFDLTFDIAGPYTLKNNFAYYGQNVKDDDGNVTDHNKNVGDMITEAVENASKDVDFSAYDWDGDYEVDQVFVLFAGQGEAAGGSEDTVWPHEWYLSSAAGAPLNYNNVKIDQYACSGELGSSETVPSGIDTICHEFSHCLGLPDFYDTSNNETQNYGMGYWDLMCSGSYNGNSFCPAGYTSYERTFCGWLTPTELTEDTSVANLKPLSEQGGAYIIYNDNHKDEYYLLECRNQTGWDAKVAGNGLMIIHVDYDPYVWMWNVPNAFDTYRNSEGNYVENDHQRCTFVPADNSQSRKNESGDPFPYNQNNSFSNASTPNAMLYNANADGGFLLNKSVKNITRNGDGTVSFNFFANDTETEAKLEGTLFYESFDKCSGVGGNDGIWKQNTGSLKTDYEGWSYADMTGFGANKCARFGSMATKGNVTSPGFDVSEEAELTFKAAPWEGETAKMRVNINGSSTTTIEPATFELATGQWTECKATIKGGGHIRLSFTTDKNRFFIDEIRVEAVSGSTGIAPLVTTSPAADNRIFDLNGRVVGTDLNTLRHGVYIQNGKKVVK